MSGGHVFWDTHLLIYWVERASPWVQQIDELVRWQRSQDLQPITSTLTLAEILVRPLGIGDEKLADRYEQLLAEIGSLPFGAREARVFAEVRSKYPSLKPTDCIQLACASTCGVDCFITNDNRLAKLDVPGIGVIYGLASWYKSRV